MKVKVFFTKAGQEFCGVIKTSTEDKITVEKILVPMINQGAMGQQGVSVQLVPISLTLPEVVLDFDQDEIRAIKDAPDQIQTQYDNMYAPKEEDKIILPTDADTAKANLTRVK